MVEESTDVSDMRRMIMRGLLQGEDEGPVIEGVATTSCELRLGSGLQLGLRSGLVSAFVSVLGFGLMLVHIYICTMCPFGVSVLGFGLC